MMRDRFTYRTDSEKLKNLRILAIMEDVKTNELLDIAVYLLYKELESGKSVLKLKNEMILNK